MGTAGQGPHQGALPPFTACPFCTWAIALPPGPKETGPPGLADAAGRSLGSRQ